MLVTSLVLIFPIYEVPHVFLRWHNDKHFRMRCFPFSWLRLGFALHEVKLVSSSGPLETWVTSNFLIVLSNM